MIYRSFLATALVMHAALPVAAEESVGAPQVVLVLPAEADDELELAVRSHLTDIEAEIVVERADLAVRFREHLERAEEIASTNDAVGVIWVDIDTEEGDILLYLFDCEGTRTMVRRLENRGTAASARVEEVALVTRSMATAVVEGGIVDVRPPEPEEPPQEAIDPAVDVDQEPRPDRHEEEDEPGPPFIEVTLGYAGQLIHEKIPWQNGVRFSTAWLSPSGRFSLGIAYVFWTPTEFNFDMSQLRLSRHSWELWGSFSVPLRALRVGGELALFGELSERETMELQGTAADPESNLVVGLALRIRLHVQLWRWLGISALVGVDGLVRRVRYVIEYPESSDRTLDPLLIRPMFTISLCGQFG